MANEITVTTKLSFTKGGTTTSLEVSNLKVDVSGSRFIHNRQEIGTSEEAIDVGDLASVGYMLLVNRDATNFVEVRAGTGVADTIKLKPGESSLIRLVATAPFAIADTAAVELEYLLIED